MREHRAFGAPGTGKTTWLAQQVTKACNTFYGSVVACSLTRTAARELAGRDTPLDHTRVGTLHSLAFRALGNPSIAEASPMLAEWNDSHGRRNGWRIEPKKRSSVDVDPLARDEDTGSHVHTDSIVQRNTMRPLGQWPDETRRFDAVWRAWKTERELLDFTDLIERAIELCPAPPMHCAVLFADEVQDYSALELRLVRQWGATCEHWVLAGDDEQAIYQFRGSSPEAFLDPPLPHEHKTILGRSWRLSRAILEHSQRIASLISRREPKPFAPRADGGIVDRLGAPLTDGLAVAQWVEERLAACESTMVLASCSYMLQQALAELRRRGVPIHNPYRRENGAWNPMRGAPERLAAWCRAAAGQPQTWIEAWRWLEHVEARRAGLQRGAKTRVKELVDDARTKGLDVTPPIWLAATGLAWPPSRDPEWLPQHLTETQRPRYDYARAVHQRGGLELLEAAPRTVLGTIHAVKGGEADAVLLAPDISQAAHRETALLGVDGRDRLARLAYVGVTRARDRVTIADRDRRSPGTMPVWGRR